MDPISKLAELFAYFPGIGERQSRRFVYYLLNRNQDYLDQLAAYIKNIKNEVKQCTLCFRQHESRTPECENCLLRAASNSLLVVEKDSDLETIKKSKAYDGLYFVLGGLVPVVEKNTLSKVRIQELIKRIEVLSQKNSLQEVILAFSLSPQGDHTDTHVRETLNTLSTEKGFVVHSLGRGLSTGTELEYSDSDTIKNALKNRQ